VAHYERSCDAFGREACLRLADAYGGGDKEARDLTRVRGYLERGCRNSSVLACDRLAVDLTEGLGGARDPVKASAARVESEEVLEGSCTEVDVPECMELARRQGVPPRVTFENRRARIDCKTWDKGDACVTLGVRYALGHGVTPDPDKARALWKRACELGRAKACSYAP
jgi:TPR repeat protein